MLVETINPYLVPFVLLSVFLGAYALSETAWNLAERISPRKRSTGHMQSMMGLWALVIALLITFEAWLLVAAFFALPIALAILECLAEANRKTKRKS